MSYSKNDDSDVQPLGKSRRQATRYEPIRRDARLAWWESSSNPARFPIEEFNLVDYEPHQQYALLLDISQSGASVVLDRVPRGKNGIWLRIEGCDKEEWAEAQIVAVRTTNRGPHLVRLAFREACPFETLRMAVCG